MFRNVTMFQCSYFSEIYEPPLVTIKGSSLLFIHSKVHLFRYIIKMHRKTISLPSSHFHVWICTEVQIITNCIAPPLHLPIRVHQCIMLSAFSSLPLAALQHVWLRLYNYMFVFSLLYADQLSLPCVSASCLYITIHYLVTPLSPRHYAFSLIIMQSFHHHIIHWCSHYHCTILIIYCFTMLSYH